MHAHGWHVGAAAALIGDAAHAMVPFHGQGMNCCFEDCIEFDACVGRRSSWEAVFAEFYAVRKPNTDAIAAMALENYLEMRERVADSEVPAAAGAVAGARAALPAALHSALLDGDVPPRDSVPHRAASAAACRPRLLAELTCGAATLADIDYERAAREIETRLAPLQDLSSVTKL